ncbi:MAG TPA: hypothetical protein VEX68_13900 [Bryobacteraceae bacterium]|nr:hypothetical protein [Bryobacteraceae bacterium]
MSSGWWIDAGNHDATRDRALDRLQLVERGRQWIREQAKAFTFPVDDIRFHLVQRDVLRGDVVSAGRVVTDVVCKLDEL